MFFKKIQRKDAKVARCGECEERTQAFEIIQRKGAKTQRRKDPVTTLRQDNPLSSVPCITFLQTPYVFLCVFASLRLCVEFFQKPLRLCVELFRKPYTNEIQ